eukprot:3296118-Rhodomonas_salina.2
MNLPKWDPPDVARTIFRSVRAALMIIQKLCRDFYHSKGCALLHCGAVRNFPYWMFSCTAFCATLIFVPYLIVPPVYKATVFFYRVRGMCYRSGPTGGTLVGWPLPGPSSRAP